MCAMLDHLDAARVIERACGALWSLAMVAENKDAMRTCGLIDVVIEGVHHNATDRKVAENACGVFASLALNDANKVWLRVWVLASLVPCASFVSACLLLCVSVSVCVNVAIH